ncbi:MAG: hypothetical protein IPJ69_05600 [Deltaproteobacteria bacterium]|nr:MAG: hypothetical protein IPJ69_05600 [Deltaproteobacteria bacterium]
MTFSWSQFILTLGGQTAIIAAFGFLGGEWIKTKFSKNLTSHAEHLKYDLQKSMVNVEQASKKRHEIYPEIYSQIIKVDGAIRSLCPEIGFSATFEDFNIEDIQSLLSKIEGPDKPKEDILKIFIGNPKEGAQALKSYLKTLNKNKARADLQHIKNDWLVYELFMTQGVSKKIGDVHSLLWSLWIDLELDDPRDGNKWKRIEALKSNIIIAINGLKTLMQEEMGIIISTSPISKI